MRDSLLVGHFLRRFLDNDLLSPNADRHQAIATACAALIAPGLAATILLSFKYQFWFHPPGVTSVFALDDRVLYFGCSMIVMGLVAAATWDALSLDARDAAILGTLPVSRWSILRAKAAPVAQFASAFAIALNLLPSVMYPALLPGKALPVGIGGFVRLIAAQSLTSAASGAFGFLAVLTARELLRALLGAAWTRRVSAVVRGALVVFLATVFLLLPVLSSNVAEKDLAPGSAAPSVMPPLWFLGLHEELAGGVLDGLPRDRLHPRFRNADAVATTQYRGYAPLFRRLAKTAIAASVVLLALAIAAYAWNSRRPVDARSARHHGAETAIARGAARLLLVRHPLSRAGFFFGLQTLSRSAPHHLAAMTSVAAGLAIAAVSLRGTDLRLVPVPLIAFVPQTVLIITSTIGFRQAARLPADPRANWHFVLAWSGDERPYLAGVKRAALVRLTLPILAVLLPVQVLLLGPAVAAAHFACGLLLAMLLMELLLLNLRRLPFVSSFTPPENLAGWAVIYLLMFLGSVYAIAWTERFAFARGGTGVLLAGTVAAVGAAHGVDAWMRRNRVAIDLEELPAPPTQRFDLHS